jgi:hypothetical protein
MNNILEIVKRHLEPSMQMLSNVITVCPDELWVNNQYGFPIWKRVLHTLESIDYWLNEFVNGINFYNLFRSKKPYNKTLELWKLAMRLFTAQLKRCNIYVIDNIY